MGYYSISSSLVHIILTYSLLLLIPFAFSDTDDMLGYYCSASSYANGSSYSQSLSHLTEDLRVNTHNDYYKGFRDASWPQDNATVYGLALCNGDVSPSDCESCVRSATTTDLNSPCPNSQEAVILRRFCLFRYSDVEFRGKIDNTIYYHTKWLGYDKTDIGTEVVEFMGNLSETAVAAPDKFFANGITNDMKSLHCTVQCTRDLSAAACTECIDDIKYYLSGLSMNTTNAQFVAGSCSVHAYSIN